MSKQVLHIDEWLIEVEPFQELVEGIVERTGLTSFEAMAMIAITKLNGVQLQTINLVRAYDGLRQATIDRNEILSLDFEQRKEADLAWRERQERFHEMQGRAVRAMERIVPRMERDADDLDESDEWKGKDE